MRILPAFPRALALLACAPLLISIAVADIPSASGDCAGDLVEITPSSDFTPLEGGAVVRHERTGLEWRRCPEGAEWTGSGCDGSASTMNWQGALQHADGIDGWRLPNVRELHTIIEHCRRPAINQQVFPGMPTFPLFWSASPHTGDSDSAWAVGFYYGYGDWYSKSADYKVWLVRGGE